MAGPVMSVAEKQRDPGLAVVLQATPPEKGTRSPGGLTLYEAWTLDLLERTCFEFRASGAWDESRVEFSGYPATVKCEVLTGRGPEALPWGWRPSHGPAPLRVEPVEHDSPPRSGLGRAWGELLNLLGNRVLHGLLLLFILAVVMALASSGSS